MSRTGIQIFSVDHGSQTDYWAVASSDGNLAGGALAPHLRQEPESSRRIRCWGLSKWPHWHWRRGTLPRDSGEGLDEDGVPHLPGLSRKKRLASPIALCRRPRAIPDESAPGHVQT